MSLALKHLRELKGQKKNSIDFIGQNKTQLIREKKQLPKSDIAFKLDESLFIEPSFDVNTINLENDEVFIIGNTCNVLDGHDDVSIKGSWTKTSNERGNRIPPLKDHTRKIDANFAQNLESMILPFTWRQLGLNVDGETEVIAFKIKPYKEDDLLRYKGGAIKQHSMGLQYINLELAINNPDDSEGFRTWNRFINDIVNREDVERMGYFWAVLEQKAIEVSAVLFASNPITPAFTTVPTNNKTLKNPPSYVDTETLSRLNNNKFDYLRNL